MLYLKKQGYHDGAIIANQSSSRLRCGALLGVNPKFQQSLDKSAGAGIRTRDLEEVQSNAPSPIPAISVLVA
ncbi:hypothetical protein TNCV_1091441 [Trichonephila clavipes]|nr:hypothetical protein TNCV_1091441 [Trichonephila clavipes]